MLKSYEAIYDHGHIQWLTEQPKSECFKMLVVVEQDEEPNNAQPADSILAESFGAWGQLFKTDVTALIETQRRHDWGDN